MKKNAITLALALLFTGFVALSSAQEVGTLTIVHTNDVHGKLDQFNLTEGGILQGGIPGQATIIKNAKTKSNDVVAISAGDLCQGSLYHKLFKGVPCIKLFSEAGYDVAVLGNHEFDDGLEDLKQVINNASFPFLCANIEFENQELSQKIRPYLIKEINGKKVAFIGLITDKLKSSTPVIKGYHVLDSTKTAQKYVKLLDTTTDFIVVVSHMGFDADKELALNVPEIDVIVGGHSHTFLQEPVVVHHKDSKTLIVQFSEFGTNMGKIELSFEKKSIKNYTHNVISMNQDVAREPAVQKKVDDLTLKLKEIIEEPAGQLLTPVESRKVKINKELATVGKLYGQAVKNRFRDIEIVFQNSRSLKADKLIPAGKITKGQIMELYPSGIRLVTLDISGMQLKSILETSAAGFPKADGSFMQSTGVDYTIDVSKQAQKQSKDGTKILQEGDRVSAVKINGKPLNSDKYYNICINEYLLSGGNGYSQFKSGKNIKITDIYAFDLIVDYVKKNSPISLNITDKIYFLKKEKSVAKGNL